MSVSDLGQLVCRLEAVATKLESKLGLGGDLQQAVKSYVNNIPDDSFSSPMLSAYDDITTGPFSEYLKLSEEIGQHVKIHANMVNNAFKAQKQFLVTVAKSKEPPQGSLSGLLKPISDQIGAIQEYRERNRDSPHFNHLSAISESISALGWVTVAPTPAPYVKEMNDAGQFYTNRILMEYKGKDQKHIEWVKAWVQTLTELQKFVKQYHTTGLVWNPKGCASSASAPPPPPPPPPMMDLGSDPAASCGGDPRAALFAQINQGSGITSGLKKVTSDQQTHKNPELRQMAPVTSKPMPGPKPLRPATSAKPPKFELDGKKWILENHQGNRELIVSQTQMQQVVYIYNCVDSIIQIKGKINSITIDSCKKTAIVFDDVVSVLEIINSQSIKVQVMGKIPTILVAKTDGFQVYLSQTSLDTEIVTSKSSEMNVVVPTPDGDFAEFPVPEQYKTVWNGKALKTEVVEIV